MLRGEDLYWVYSLKIQSFLSLGQVRSPSRIKDVAWCDKQRSSNTKLILPWHLSSEHQTVIWLTSEYWAVIHTHLRLEYPTQTITDFECLVLRSNCILWRMSLTSWGIWHRLGFYYKGCKVPFSGYFCGFHWISRLTQQKILKKARALVLVVSM